MIIKFYTVGCQPCKAVTQILDHEQIAYESVDIGKDITQAVKYKVRSVPTLLNTDTGKTLVGFHGIFATTEWLNDNTD